MPSRYEQILEANGADTPRRWQPFARRGAPRYSAETTAWGASAYGYKTAADVVARECCDSNTPRDTLWSPIFFLYRHWIEIALKSTWVDYYSLGLHDSAPPQNEHGLLPLWREIRGVSIQVGFLSAEDQYLRRVDSSIELFNSVDERSTHSRYPTVRGEYHSLDIDIERLISAVDEIDTIFFGLQAMIGEYG